MPFNYQASAAALISQIQAVMENWPCNKDNVTWLNGGEASEDLALVFMTYGNQAELEWYYSTATLIIYTPKLFEKDSEEGSEENPEESTEEEPGVISEMNSEEYS